MTGARFSLVPVMDHEIHVTEWGDAGKPALMMWHGLARNGRDFDELAAALSDQYRVFCPDLIGRGLSSWSDNPEAEYSIEYFTGIASDLMDHFGLDRVAWLGTSLGGLIGMRLAAGPDQDRITSLLLNDVGPEIPASAIDRILAYVGELPVFSRYGEAEAWLRTVYQPFGPADDRFWQRMARHSMRRMADGRLTLHYDPRITVEFSASAHEFSSWERWRRIRVPSYLFRGQSSDILTEGIACRMRASGPKPGETLFAECGHAPNLSRPDDIALVRRVLAELAG